MKFEQDLVRDPHAELHVLSRADAVLSRREVRQASDVLVMEGLRLNRMEPMVDGVCTTMLAVAIALNRHEIEPDVVHLIEAAAALVEDARTVFDAGLRVDEFDKAMIGAVMLEIVSRGVCAVLGQPYKECMLAKNAGLPLPVILPAGASNGTDREQADGPADGAG